MSSKPSYPPYEKGTKQRKPSLNHLYITDVGSEYVVNLLSDIPTIFHPPCRTDSQKLTFSASKDNQTDSSNLIPLSNPSSSDNKEKKQPSQGKTYASVLSQGL